MVIVKVRSPTQQLLQISQKGLLLIPGFFIVLKERWTEKNILVKHFSIYLILKMDA